MPTFRDQVHIAASTDWLFTLTQDYARRPDWDPFLKEARLLAAAPAVGVRAWCVARTGLGMETEYVAYKPPRLAAVRMIRGPWFLGTFAGSWRFETTVDQLARVTFAYHLKCWPRWLGWLLNPVLRWVFARDTRRRLLALKKAAERPLPALVPGV